MRLLIQHETRYHYPTPAAFGPHVVRLRPANHTRARVETYSLNVAGADGVELRWLEDPHGNQVARLTFPRGHRASALSLRVELAVDIRPVNPFDFFLDDRIERMPFVYPEELARELAPFVGGDAPAADSRLAAFIKALPTSGKTIDVLVAINRAVATTLRYVVREEAGVRTPEESLVAGSGSCRDAAVLLIAALRARGLAARFVSGYLVQLTDEGMIPDQPRGMGRDVVDLHAWAEVYLPGGGWIGFDATSGLLCGEGHIPLACTAEPALAAPVEGSSDVGADQLSFTMTVARLGHEARPTAPFTDEAWHELLAAGDVADARLAAQGLTLTIGGEPTFNGREDAAAPEWQTEALGPTKRVFGEKLARELKKRLIPGGVLLHRQGKHYPGESLPRWALDVIGRSDGVPVWKGDSAASGTDAEAVARALAKTLAVPAECLLPAFEEPWQALASEAALPVDIDPFTADLDDSEERRRVARILERGLGEPVGWVLPLQRLDGKWISEAWSFRRGRLFLLPGDSPVGLRLPLASLPAAPPPPPPRELPLLPPDPRRPKPAATPPGPPMVRTALCVELRDGRVHVFLPPVDDAADFLALCAAAEATLANPVLEGYGPPSSATLRKITVTPDPGVLEVNVPPSASTAAYAALMEQVFDAGLHAGLHSEKYLLDGRQAGSGGGNHITVGGPTPLESPFIRRPDLLASLVGFVQHHPSLSYLFTGLFVGPTSQAPRVDEGRQDALDELDLALSRLHEQRPNEAAWLGDALLRNLLVDITGNTHRAELCLDKLFDPNTPTGRQGLVELRAFEMPPHPRMAVAQGLLVRALVAAFAAEPYRPRRLVRWGQSLHDKFLLPAYMWRDFEDVLAYLAGHGLRLPAEVYRSFLEARCPLAGRIVAGEVTLEVRNALEPWPVLGEEMTAFGTSRYVDSSLERIEVLVRGLVPERHAVLVNGHNLPLAPTGTAGEAVAGVRFRAWAPPHALQPHLGIHHPVRLDVVDSWARRGLGACAYHVWHPLGRGFDAPPLTRFEASARRAQRFTVVGPLPAPVTAVPTTPAAETPCTLDLRRYPIDRPMPVAE